MTNKQDRKTLCQKCMTIYGPNEEHKCQKKKWDIKSKAEIERNKALTLTPWRKFRKRIMDRDNGYCQRCLIKYKTIKSAEQVHHIKPRIKYEHLMYEATNCVSLCALCNHQLGTKEQLDFSFEAKELDNDYAL